MVELNPLLCRCDTLKIESLKSCEIAYIIDSLDFFLTSISKTKNCTHIYTDVAEKTDLIKNPCTSVKSVYCKSVFYF